MCKGAIMATIQAKKSRGHKYWYIVESRRVNGKPRPIVLAYLGKAEDLLRRLQETGHDKLTVKSWSHGAVAALLQVAAKLDVVSIINKHVKSRRHYMAKKPLRNKLTVGITLLLAGIGRVCKPTSKRSWWKWARTTSCEKLLKVSLSKLDSQHFWDLMDALPEKNIKEIEFELLKNVMDIFSIKTDTIFYDTTNFFTFIDTTNIRCRIAQRGHNKQKRNDLRQVGLALIVSREDYIPLFHHTYKGNIHDTTVFNKVLRNIKKRLEDLNFNLGKHTFVFDRGCNSKKNLNLVNKLQLHYVGALTPSHHKDLIEDTEGNFVETNIDGKILHIYRDKRTIWEKERTVLVFVSKKLKEGQIRGIYKMLNNKKNELKKLQKSLANPKGKKQTYEQLKDKINKLLQGQFMKDLISYTLSKVDEGKFVLTYKVNKENIASLEDTLGFRIVMTDRHEWSTAEIINAFYGQSFVENTFKNLKNPYHLSLKPGFHWTDQKIRVHYFLGVLGYLLAALLWREARKKANYKGRLDTLLNTLNDIRLAAILENTGKRGRPKAIYKLEEMRPDEKEMIKALNLEELHVKPPKINGVGVYTE